MNDLYASKFGTHVSFESDVWDEESEWYSSASEEEYEPETFEELAEAEGVSEWAARKGRRAREEGGRHKGEPGPPQGVYRGRRHPPVIPLDCMKAFVPFTTEFHKTQPHVVTNLLRAAALIMSDEITKVIHPHGSKPPRAKRPYLGKRLKVIPAVPLRVFQDIFLQSFTEVTRWAKAGPTQAQVASLGAFSRMVVRGYKNARTLVANAGKMRTEIIENSLRRANFFRAQHNLPLTKTCVKLEQFESKLAEARETLLAAGAPLEQPAVVTSNSARWREKTNEEAERAADAAAATEAYARELARRQEVARENALKARVEERRAKAQDDYHKEMGLPRVQLTNCKGHLQESVARQPVRITYNTVSVVGGFRTTVTLAGGSIRLGGHTTNSSFLGGASRTIRGAEQSAARVALLSPIFRGKNKGRLAPIFGEAEPKYSTMNGVDYYGYVPEGPPVVNDHVVKSDLNGNAGEATNGDDFPARNKARLAKKESHAEKLLRVAERKLAAAERQLRNRAKGASKPKGEKMRKQADRFGAARGLVHSVPGQMNGVGGLAGLHGIIAYALSQIDATSVRHHAITVPVATPVPTFKTTSRVNFNVATGVNNCGFVMITPNFARDRDSIIYTTSAYAGNSNDGATLRRGTTSAVVGVSGVPNRQTYSVSDCQSTDPNLLLRGRCVSVHLQMKFNGAFTNRQGTIRTVTDREREDLSGVSQAALMDMPFAKKYDVNTSDSIDVHAGASHNDHREIAPCSQLSAFLLNPPNADPTTYWDYTNGLPSCGYHASAIVLIEASGTSTTPLTFECEATFIYEWTGTRVGSLASPNVPCPNGIEAASALQHEIHSLHARKPNQPIMQVAEMVLRRHGPDYARAAGDLIGGPIAGGVAHMAAKKGIEALARTHFRL